ncbi:MAG: NeuD/PglB/VioB family sugar acetyltransferase [Pseudomonadota bacterium]
MDNIVIVGSRGHAKYIIEIVEREGKYKIAGLIDRFRDPGSQTQGYPVLGKEEDLPSLIGAHSLKGVIIGIGDNVIRSTVAATVGSLCPGLSFVNAIHPGTSIARDVFIGKGTVIYPGHILGPGCSIGRFSILFTNSSLGHDSTMGDFASLGARVVTGGYCEIGAYAAVNIGAVLVDRVSVGEHAVIGAGSTVLASVGPHAVAYGTPAQVIRARRQAQDPVP